MAICWWCHWGWPKPIADIFNDAVEKLNGDDLTLLYGPSHVVWADENWDCAQWCLDHFDEYLDYYNHTHEEYAVVRESIERLLAVPEEFKHQPLEYDDEHPERYPPPSHWVMEHL